MVTSSTFFSLHWQLIDQRVLWSKKNGLKRWICLKRVLCWFHSPRSPWSFIPLTLSNQIISFYDLWGIHFKFCVGSMRKYLLSEAKEKNRPEFLQAWQADDTECVPTEKRAVTVESFSPHRPQKALQVPLQRAVFSEFTWRPAWVWKGTYKLLCDCWLVGWNSARTLGSQAKWERMVCYSHLQTLIWLFTDISDQWCWATLAAFAVHLDPVQHCKSAICVGLVAQSRPILCNCMDCSPPGSSVHGILQERILE